MKIDSTVLEVVKIIEENLKDITSVILISDRLGFSKNYLNRIFNNTLGISVLDYIKKRKITDAIHNSANNRGNIIDMAFEYGFNSHEVFIRNCKRYFKRSPSELIKMKTWSGFEKLNSEKLWFISNRDKITMKIVKLPQLVLEESETGNVLIESMNFTGIKSKLKWDSKYNFKLIPKGIYKTFFIENSDEDYSLLEYIKFIYPNRGPIIEFKKNNTSRYYIGE